MLDLKTLIKETQKNLKTIKNLVNIDELKAQLENINKETDMPDIWNDREKAERLLREKSRLENAINKFSEVINSFNENFEFATLAENEKDEIAISELAKEFAKLKIQTDIYKAECLFSGEADKNDCFFEINTGVGGTDASDFSAMLLRMYLRWFENKGFKVETLNITDDEIAGIKSATLKVKGENAFGWCKSESGVHRLVRLSPFNANNKRETSFSSIWVYPVIDNTINIEINEGDLKIDTYRASGAGGQHVNKTSSAVRITHLPTKIVVQCQNDRSQHRNKAEAIEMIKSRLYELELRKQDEAKTKLNLQKTDNSWGNQIRSYVLHPYQMVKDLRSDYETGNVRAMLDGELIDEFVLAMLEKRE
jgi:peptide chain release factor 2